MGTITIAYGPCTLWILGLILCKACTIGTANAKVFPKKEINLYTKCLSHINLSTWNKMGVKTLTQIGNDKNRVFNLAIDC